MILKYRLSLLIMMEFDNENLQSMYFYLHNLGRKIG
jgi:hypothetical protein